MTPQPSHHGGQPARGRPDPGADLLDRRHGSATAPTSSSTSRCSTSRAAAFGDWDQPFVRLSYASWLTPDTGLRLRPADRRAPPAQAAAGARRLRPGRLRPDPRVGHRARRRPDPDLDRAAQGRRSRAATLPLLLYGYGSYEISYDPFVSIAAAVAARPRHGLRARPHPRRRRDGPALVRARQAAARRRTPSPTTSTAPSTWSTPAGPTPTRWSASAAAPVGCSWARSPTWRRTCSPASWPRCRSSTR